MFPICRDFRYMQYLAAFVVSFSISSQTVGMVWLSPALYLMESGNSPLNTVSTEDISWISSTLHLGNIIGFMSIGYVLENVGRRTILKWFNIPIFILWLITAFNQSTLIICIVRFFMGIFTGISAVCGIIYISEISDQDIRGKLGSFVIILATFGSLGILVFGPYMTYINLCFACSVIPIISFFILQFIPESPYYLVRNGSVDELSDSLKMLCTKNISEKGFLKQIDDIYSYVEQNKTNKATFSDIIKNKTYRKSFLINFVLKHLHMLSGGTALSSNLQLILKNSGGMISPDIGSVLIGFVQLPIVYISTFIVDRMGRKPLLIISSIGCAFSMFGLGYYFYTKEVLNSMTTISWLPIASLLVFFCMNTLGMSSVPILIQGELFASNIKEKATALIVCYGGFLNFLLLKFFQPISKKWGYYVPFWTFCCVCIVGAVVVYFCVPETKNKTFADIQIKLNKSKKDKGTNSEIVFDTHL